MRLIYLFLFNLICLVTAKYLPDEQFNSRALQGRNERSASDESNISSESDDNDEDDDCESVLKQEGQKYFERLEKEKRKQEKEWRKHEAKIEEEKRKYQERLQKEQRKHLEKIQKEKQKQEESQKKLQEKLAKAERKREENIKKELEKLEKETLKNEKQASNTWRDVSSNNEINTVDLEDLWKQYVYKKYGINSNSTEIEKKSSLYKYLQDEIGLNANSTKSEQRQAIIKVVRTKLQSDTSENSLKSYLLKNLTPKDKMNLEAELKGKIEKLDNETMLINNVTLPWIKTAQQQIEEKRTLLQALLEFLSNTVSNWTTEQTTTSGSFNNAETNGATNQINEIKPQITDLAPSNPSADIALNSNASKPEVVISESANNGLESNNAAGAGTDVNDPNNQIASTDISSSGLNNSYSPGELTEIENSDTNTAKPEELIPSDLTNSNSADSLVVSQSVDANPNTETSGVSSTDSLVGSKPVDSLLTAEIPDLETASGVSSTVNTLVDNVNDPALASTGEVSPNTHNPAEENQNLNGESMISSTSKANEITTILTDLKQETGSNKTTANDVLTNSENTNSFDFEKTTVSSQLGSDNVNSLDQNNNTIEPISSIDGLSNSPNTTSDVLPENGSSSIDTNKETTLTADLIPSESNSIGAIDTSIPSNNDLSNSLSTNDASLAPANIIPGNDEVTTGGSSSSEPYTEANVNIATDSSSAFSINADNNIPEQTSGNYKDSLTILDTNVSSSGSDIITSSKDGVLPESDSTSTLVTGKDQLNTDSISNNFLNATPSESTSEKITQESIVQADLSIGSQNTEESVTVSDKGESVTETVSWPDVVSNGTEIDKNNEVLPISSIVEPTKNDAVIDVKEPHANELLTDSTDTTISSTVSYVAIPAETGATVIDIVPQ